MSVIHVSSADFRREVLESSVPVLLDFWAVWCGPCRMIAPALEEIANERSDIKVCKVNVDDELTLAQEYGVSSIPTLLVIKNGEITKRSVGALSKDGILALLS